jgi:hypothetical protein
MPIPNPPLTDNKVLNYTLLSIIKEVNRIDQRQVALISDIIGATSFADLQTKVNNRR